MKKNILLSFGKKPKLYLQVNVDTGQILVDTKFLPESALLCAMFDCTSMWISDVGKAKKEERQFLDMEWIINEWGGPKDLIELIKKRKQVILDDLPNLRKKYEDYDASDNGAPVDELHLHDQYVP